ncbi:MAG: hypothetical protein FWD27_08670 [Coriobacteriia bacterium]|nr:hypothetical protein [Coriobacteriia bacterium]
MAFRVLGDEQLAVLSDQQLLQYETELDLYQQRIAFAEQLELLENVTIDAPEPNLKPITLFGPIEVKAFIKPEHALVTIEPRAKPELQINPVVIPVFDEPVLPAAPKHSKPRVEHIERYERANNLELPKLQKVTSPKKRFKKPRIKQPDLPTYEKLDTATKPLKKWKKVQPVISGNLEQHIEKARRFEPSRKEWRNIQGTMPKPSLLSNEQNPFVIPEKTQQGIQRVSALLAKIKSSNVSERPKVELPTFIKPGIAFKPIKKTKQKKPRLPKIAQPSMQIKGFIKPEQPRPKLPAAKKPHFDKKVYVKPEHPRPKLPAAKKPHFNKKTFSEPVNINVNLPIAAKVSFNARPFKQVKRSQPVVAVSKAPSVSIKPFTIPERGIPQLPKRKPIVIPDAESRFKELLAQAAASVEDSEG